MTWAKIDDRFNDDPKLLELPRGIRLMHLEGIVWSCRHETDGRIPRFALTKVTDEPDADVAVKALVESGLWSEVDNGWSIVDFLKSQRSAEDIENQRKLGRERQRRNRQHRAGDHSLCDPDWCKAARNGVTHGGTDDVSDDTPTRPDPTRPKGRVGEGKGAAVAAAPLRSRRDAAPSGPKTGFSFALPAVADLCSEHGRDRKTCPFCKGGRLAG